MAKQLKDLTDAYKGLLDSISVETKSNGALVQTLNDVDRAVMVHGRPLTLPTQDTVNNYTDAIALFHPLCENILLGESPVLQELRVLVMEFLNILTMDVVEALLSINVDENLMSALSPDQLEMMRCTAGADATTLANWKSIKRKIDPRESKARVLTVYLKRGAELDDTRYKRLAVVNFDIYDQFTDGTSTVYGAKVRKVDLRAYQRIFQSLFPGIDNDGTYSAGSNSLVAPYFDSLLKAYHKVLKALNSVTWALRKPIEESMGRRLHVKDKFFEPFNDVVTYRDVLPTMPLNDGDKQSRRETEAPPKPEQAQSQVSGSFPTAQEAHQANLAHQAKAFVPQPTIEPVAQPTYNSPLPNMQSPPQSNSGFPTLEQQMAGMGVNGMSNNPFASNFQTGAWSPQQQQAMQQAAMQQAMQQQLMQQQMLQQQMNMANWGNPNGMSTMAGMGGNSNNPFLKNFR